MKTSGRRVPRSLPCRVASAFPYYSPNRIQADLALLDAAPRKRWGQCFLIEGGLVANMADRIAAAATNEQGGAVLEIGPGLGALSWALLERSVSVAAVEIDPAMSRILEELTADATGLPDASAFYVHTGDARDALRNLRAPDGLLRCATLRPAPIGNQSEAEHVLRAGNTRVLCGNLPYYITSELLTASVRLPGLQAGFFLTQLEFADRIVAADARSSLNVFLRNFGEWRQVLRLKASAFFPRPRVDSAFIEFRAHSAGPRTDPTVLEGLLRMSFGARRKKLANSWKQDRRALLDLGVLLAAAGEAGVDPNARAEAVPVDLFFALSDAYLRLSDG